MKTESRAAQEWGWRVGRVGWMVGVGGAFGSREPGQHGAVIQSLH